MRNADGYGEGNALGGVVFEFVDEWWKAYEPSLHDVHTQWPGPFPDGWVFEERFGVCGTRRWGKQPLFKAASQIIFCNEGVVERRVTDVLKGENGNG